MAFYDRAPGKKKKTSYGDLGSWEEEGRNYRKTQISRKDSTLTKGKKTGISNSRKTETIRGKKNPDEKPAGRRKAVQREVKTWEKQIQEVETADYRNFEYRESRDRGRSEDVEPENILCGRNPIREALKRDRDIEKLLVQKGELSGSAREIVAMAKEKKIMIQEVEKSRLDEITLHHQGLIAFASAYTYATVEDILDNAKKRKEAPFIILLDGVTDPHNLGAVIRTAECTGAHGVIVPQHRSVGLTPAAVKASAGAVEHIPVARVNNLNRTIDELKKQGIWVYAVTMGEKDYESVEFRDGTALVIGAEGEGISRLTLDKCDMAVSLPVLGALDSLNASVAAGVMMYRVLSSRRKRD